MVTLVFVLMLVVVVTMMMADDDNKDDNKDDGGDNDGDDDNNCKRGFGDDISELINICICWWMHREHHLAEHGDSMRRSSQHGDRHGAWRAA